MLACILGKSGDVFFPKLRVTTNWLVLKILLRDFLKRANRSVIHCESGKRSEERNWRLILKIKIPIQSIILNLIPLAKNYMKNFTPKTIQLNLNSFKSLGVMKNLRNGHLLKILKNLWRMQA